MPTDSTIKWTNDGAVFTVLDTKFAIGINSQGAAGTSDLPAGTYPGVDVNAIGNWTLDVVPK